MKIKQLLSFVLIATPLIASAQNIESGLYPGSDISDMLKNPKFNDGFTGWTTINNDPSKLWKSTNGAANCVEVYQSVVDLYQIVNDVPDGIYSLTAQAFERSDTDYGRSNPKVFLYMNDFQTPVINVLDDAQDPATAVSGISGQVVPDANCFLDGGEATGALPYDYNFNGKYIPNSLEGASYAFQGYRYMQKVYGLVEGGTMKIGLTSNGAQVHGAIWSNFTLTYEGKTAEALYELLDTYVVRAEEYLEENWEDMTTPASDAIDNAIAAAVDSQEEGDADEMWNALVALNKAMAEAQENVAAVEKLINALDAMEIALNEAEAPSQAAIDAFDEVIYTDHSNMTTAEVEKFIEQVNLVAAMLRIPAYEDASDDNPIYMPSVIKNADFEFNANNGDWTWNKYDTQNGPNIDNGKFCGFWDASAANLKFEIYQTLLLLPAGTYNLSAKAVNSLDGQADNGAEGRAFLYATTSSGVTYSTPIEVSEANVAKTYSISFTLKEGETVDVGFKTVGTMAARWFAGDDFELWYFGAESARNFTPYTIEINEKNFPDENFRNYLLGQNYGRDNIITEKEIKEIFHINVTGENISNLKGIEFFTTLTHLNCFGNQLTSLDVSSNKELTFLYCDGNQLTSLDVSNNTALTHLVCFGNQLTSLDVSSNKDLTYLECNGNLLTSLDVSSNKALTYLFCSGNQLTSLEVSNNTALTHLDCYDNQLTSLDVSSNKDLTSLDCDGNQLTSLDANNTALTHLGCYDNQLTSLDVSSNKDLTSLYCGGNQLTSLDVSSNKELTFLSCDGNQLTSLDVSSNKALTRLYCDGNQLTSLDVSSNKALTSLNCDGNQLTSLDVSSNKDLTSLYCGGNQLTSLDVSNNTALTSLGCYGNQLTSLDVSSNKALTRLSVYNNQIKGKTMDAFISSLPTNSNNYIYIYNSCGNICTRSQVEAIKAKGWIPLVFSLVWKEYEGCNEPNSDVISVGASGLSTYCPAFDMDFSEVKEIAAYKATIDGNNVLLEKVTSVAAGEGVLLRSLNGGEATEEVPIKEAEKNENNAFVGVLEAKTLKETDGNVTNFVLSKKNGVVGFYKANNTPISAWKAYLPVENYTPEMAAKGLNIIFSDATDISDVKTQEEMGDDTFYTLSGTRVTNPTKGIYIKNGKKVVVK